MDATGTERAVLVGAVLRGDLGGARGRRAPGAGGSASSRSHRPAVFRFLSPNATSIRSMSRSPDHQGWARYNRHYWLTGGLRRLHPVLLRADVPGTALQQAVRGLPGLGCATPIRSCWPTPRRVDWAWTARSAPRWRPPPGGSAARSPLSTAPKTGSGRSAIGERLAELTGGSFIAVEDGGHALPAREPVMINQLIRDVVTGAVADRLCSRRWSPGPCRTGRCSHRPGAQLGARTEPAPPGAVPVLPDRAGPRPARRGHRRRAAPAAPGPARSTGWPSTR